MGVMGTRAAEDIRLRVQCNMAPQGVSMKVPARCGQVSSQKARSGRHFVLDKFRGDIVKWNDLNAVLPGGLAATA